MILYINLALTVPFHKYFLSTIICRWLTRIIACWFIFILYSRVQIIKCIFRSGEFTISMHNYTRYGFNFFYHASCLQTHSRSERLNYSTQRIEMLLVIIWNLYNPLCRSDKDTAESSRSVKSGAGNTIINREDV